jgi:hypothetical protein
MAELLFQPKAQFSLLSTMRPSNCHMVGRLSEMPSQIICATFGPSRLQLLISFLFMNLIIFSKQYSLRPELLVAQIDKNECI